MAKDIITRFKLETTGFDSKIKEAAKELSAYSKTATQAKEGFNQFTKANVDAAKALGTMETSTTNVKDRVKELVGAYNEAAKAYEALSDEHKQSDWAKALAGSLTQLQQRIKETKVEMQSLGDGMKGEGGLFSGIGGKMSGALQVFGGNLLTKGAGMLAGLASEMGDMVKQGVELAKQGEGIRVAFERLGRGDILQGLREATHGTVTDLELMKAAVKFNDFKLPLDELGTMLAFAQQKAKDTGQSVDYMVDSIVTGLGRKSLMILDNLGLSATEVKDRMAETGDMTKAVGEIIREQMAKAGDYVETAADRAAQANVSLQNKMEELGRKFAPVEEASNQLWTSMKIGILDIVGGPLAKLLNQLTEAGRLKNMLNDLNGGEDGKPTEVERQVNRVRILKKAGGNERAVNTLASGIIEDYNRQIMAIDAKIKKDGYKMLNPTLKTLERRMQALQILRDQFASAVKDLTKPVDVNINTSKSEQNVETLRMKLIELEAQRKKAVKEGDQTQVKSLTQQINATKTNIRALDPTALKTGTTSTSPQQRAEEQVKDALSKYNETIELATKQMEAGNITEAEFKSQMLSQQQRLYDAYGQAYRTYADPKYKDAQQKAADEIVRLGGEVKTATEAQKKTQEAARQLEQAQKELAKYEVEAAAALKRNDLTSYYSATSKVEASKAKIAQMTTPVTSTQEDGLARARKLQTIKLAPKEFTISANDEDALAKVQKIQGVKLSPKEFTITASDEDALAKVRKIQGVKISPKEFTITATDEEALGKVRKMEGVKLTPKTFVVTAETADALSQLRDVIGEQVPDKAFTITATDEALPLLQAIEGVNIEPKTFVVTAETADAMSQLREVMGEHIPDKAFTISATDESLPLLQAIEGISIQPKEFTITATGEEALAKVQKIQGVKLSPKEFTISTDNEEALAKVRKIQGVKLSPKEFTITATDEEALGKVRKMEGVKLTPKKFIVTAEAADALSQLREVIGEQVTDKAFTITATDEALPLLQAIEGVSIEPKTFVVTAETDDALSQLREVVGEQVPDKAFTISATDESLPLLKSIEGISIQPKEFTITATDEEALAKVQKIQGVKLLPKEFTISTDNEEALAKVQKIQGIKLTPKEFAVSANDEDALAKVRKMEGVKLTPKTFVVTAETVDALSQLREVMGEQVPDKTFIISATDKSLPLMQAIAGVSIEPKTFSVTAETAEAMSQLREVMGEQIPDKTFIISATDESLPLMQAIESVSIKPKTFVVTAETDEAMSQLRKVMGEQIPDKTFIISATDESLPLMKTIDGVSIQPKTFVVTAETDDAMSQIREVMGEQVPDKTFIISATDESLPLMQAIKDVSITPKEFIVTANTEQAQESIKKLNVLSEQTEESLAKPRKPQGQQGATTPNFTLTQNNLQGFISNIQKQMGDTSLTTDLFGDLTSQLNDAKMLSSAIQTAIKNGLDPAALGLDNIWKQVFNINPGDYIDDSQWEELRKKLEESIGKPIEINFKTGEMKTLTNDAKTTEKSFREAASAVSSVSSALSQLEDPGAKIAGIIGQAIANIALGFAQATAASSGGGIFGWIAAITGGLATMVSTISAIHNATGYAQGGIVKGSTYSGDRVQGLVDGVTPVGLNAGEVVLNHSQQATLAAELADRDNGGGTSSRPYVDAETIYLGLNNFLKRSGRGEIVTTKK